jgi:hypothetical protein
MFEDIEIIYRNDRNAKGISVNSMSVTSCNYCTQVSNASALIYETMVLGKIHCPNQRVFINNGFAVENGLSMILVQPLYG